MNILASDKLTIFLAESSIGDEVVAVGNLTNLGKGSCAKFG